MGISPSTLQQLSELCAGRLGLSYPPARWSDLERGILSAALDLGAPDPDVFVKSLLSSPPSRDQIEALASHLTVGETYFYRDKAAFDALEKNVLPEMMRWRQGERRLRIWSAGSSTGEEAYSIAIAVSRAIPDWRDWGITILATDINPRFLKRASQGVYGRWSFRDCPAWLKETYFRGTGDGRYSLLPAIREMVRCAYLNLAEDTYPSLVNDTNAMDLVFCRNVLMYMTPERARRVVRNLHLSLAEGGWIFVSPSEASRALFDRFDALTVQGAILFRKGLGKPEGLPDTVEPTEVPGRQERKPWFDPQRKADRGRRLLPGPYIGARRAYSKFRAFGAIPDGCRLRGRGPCA